MSGPQRLLRKASIERMSSPEQLDMAMRVTSPAGWVALLALGVIIVATIVWSIVGRISERVDGTGIVLRGENVQTIQVTAAGTLSELLVAEGDPVEQGQVVARVELPEIEAQINATREKLADLERQDSEQRAQMSRLQSSYRTQLRDLQAQLDTKREMLSKGLARQQDVLAIQGQIAAVESQMLQSQLGQTGRGNVVDDTRRQLQQLEESFEVNSIVRSPHAGRVAAVLASEGERLPAGSRIVNLESAEDPFHFLVFIPFTEGKKIKPGMEVRIAPTTVKPEEYGFIVGEVRSVSSQAVTPEEVRRTLNNDQLAQRFAKDTPFRIRAVPELDPATPTGFRWTSSAGPPIDITSSTPVTAQVIIDRKRPISYVIPMAKKAIGVT